MIVDLTLHKLLTPDALSGEPQIHKLCGPVDLLYHALEPRLLGHVYLHLPGLMHGVLPQGDTGQPPPLPDDGRGKGKATSVLFPSVSRFGKREKPTSP